MDSQLTLVDPGPPTVYFLSSSDLKDAVVYAHPSDPLYCVKSEAGQMTIVDGHHPSRVIAIIHHKELRPDTISFPTLDGTGTVTSTQKWLKKTKLPDGTVVRVMDTKLGSYVWKADSRSRLRIFSGHDLENPVAACYLNHSCGKPILALEYVAEPLRDDIVVAYLIHRRKMVMEDLALDVIVGGQRRA